MTRVVKIAVNTLLVLLLSGLPQAAAQQMMSLEFAKEKPSIKVQVLGQVRHPGIYSIPPYERVSTAFGAAGGANEQGSLRTVLLMRNGLVIDTLDLYRFLAFNEQENNPKVEDGDIIFIPVAQNVVRVAGQVWKPGNYELKQGERLWDVIRMAGGFTPVATKEEIKIENIARPGEVASISFKRLVIDNDESVNIELKEGDVVTVPTTPTTVTVVGQVQKGGTFPFEPGTVVSYYLGMAGGYGERASTRNIKINRWGGKSLSAKEATVVESGDVIIVGEMQIKGWRDYISVTGQLLTMFFIVWSVTK
jgi:protein involved in polysaccharide export with SLBB domain